MKSTDTISEWFCSHAFGDATLQIGSTSTTLTCGDTVEFVARLEGVSTDRVVDKGHIALKTRFMSGETVHTTQIASTEFISGLSVENGVSAVETTSFSVPHDSPGTVGSVDAWLDISLESADKTTTYETFVVVEEPAPFRTMFETMFEFGFTLEDALCLSDTGDYGPEYAPVLRFRDDGSRLPADVDTLSVFYRSSQNGVTFHAQAGHVDSESANVSSAETTTLHPDEVDSDEIRTSLRSLINQVST